MLLLLVPILAAAVVPVESSRVELPIKMQPGRGARRYSVTIMVDGQPIEAALDTGSVGLRILAPAVSLKGEGPDVRVSFNSGVELEGSAVRAKVSFGSWPEKAFLVQRIERVGCRNGVTQCEAAGADIAQYKIMSDGVPGRGFSAILGIGVRNERLDHPLVNAGVARWIVDLPSSPERPGRLILNPTGAEAARYRRVPFLPKRNEIAGCLIAGSRKICGPAMVDTGATGLQVFGGTETDLLPPDTQAKLQLGEDASQVEMPVTIGSREQAAMMRIRPARPDANLSLSFGIAPYLRWSILYDYDARTLGVADHLAQ